MLPPLFTERLYKIIPPKDIEAVLKTFDQKRVASIRLNTLKAEPAELVDFLASQGITSSNPAWYKAAFILEGVELTAVSRWALADAGKIYIQSLSSMLPVVVLDPQPGETVLDLCAAPGSKTSQM